VLTEKSTAEQLFPMKLKNLNYFIDHGDEGLPFNKNDVFVCAPLDR